MIGFGGIERMSRTEMIFVGLLVCLFLFLRQNRNRQIQGRRVDLVRDAVKGRDVTECADDESKCGRCLNGGRCVFSGDGGLSGGNGGGGGGGGVERQEQQEQQEQQQVFGCACRPGFTGEWCQSRVCPGANPCLGPSSTCVVGADNDVLCLCPYGKTGRRCQLGEPFLSFVAGRPSMRFPSSSRAVDADGN